MRRLSFALVATLVPTPALAQFPCPDGDVIALTLRPVPDCRPALDPPLLCTDDTTVVRWSVDSTCEGKYTVKIVGDAFKAGITAPLPCNQERDYEGQVHGDDKSLVCLPGPPGVYGYFVAVCPPGGDCLCTDPGIWVNRKGLTPQYVPTQADYDAALKEARSVHKCRAADLPKLTGQVSPKKPAPKPKP
jgi:hypothetical protein